TPIPQVHLCPVDRPQTQSTRGDRELHRPRDGVVVGQRERPIAELLRGWNELVGQRRAIEEREGRMAVELDVHENTCSLPDRMETSLDRLLVAANLLCS